MQGDFEAFYLRHFKAIYRVCYAFMKNAADAEDYTEDAFVKAMSCDISFENERHERVMPDNHRYEYLQGQAQALVAAEGNGPR